MRREEGKGKEKRSVGKGKEKTMAFSLDFIIEDFLNSFSKFQV